MLNPLGNVVGQRVHVNMTRFVTCYNGEFTFTLEYMYRAVGIGWAQGHMPTQYFGQQVLMPTQYFCYTEVVA